MHLKRIYVTGQRYLSKSVGKSSATGAWFWILRSTAFLPWHLHERGFGEIREAVLRVWLLSALDAEKCG